MECHWLYLFKSIVSIERQAAKFFIEFKRTQFGSSSTADGRKKSLGLFQNLLVAGGRDTQADLLFFADSLHVIDVILRVDACENTGLNKPIKYRQSGVTNTTHEMVKTGGFPGFRGSEAQDTRPKANTTRRRLIFNILIAIE
jgi:hypothetical protein